MAQLPKWLKRQESGAFVVDPDIVYPIVFKALGVKDADIDQYWIETAYQCAKMAVQDIVSGTEFDPRPKLALTIVIGLPGAGHKERWALSGFPRGRGPEVATKGLEAKASYARITGALRG